MPQHGFRDPTKKIKSPWSFPRPAAFAKGTSDPAHWVLALQGQLVGKWGDSRAVDTCPALEWLGGILLILLIGLSLNRISIKYWVIVEPGFNQTNAMVLPEKWLPWFLQRISLWWSSGWTCPIMGFFNLLAHLRKSPSNAFSESRWHSLQNAFSKCCRSFSDRPPIQSNSWWPRFPVPVYYEDACGEREWTGSHSMLLPHEIVGSFYRFGPVDLMSRLTGAPGEP